MCFLNSSLKDVDYFSYMHTKSSVDFKIVNVYLPVYVFEKALLNVVLLLWDQIENNILHKEKSKIERHLP